ncbi:MAG: DUF302 domain-containing protein [Actinomycetota bacterium]|nr:DUF302 domain-containing protein [Actinomycetota bacterium]
MSYSMSRTFDRDFDLVRSQVGVALADQGFGVITEIDMQATLKAKVGAEIDRYLILGACNPAIAFRALQVEPEVGLLLPCNVVIRSIPDGTTVDFIDPAIMSELAANPDMQSIAAEVAEKLSSALSSIQS